MVRLNPAVRTATAFAPATCGNVAAGFDILGFAFDILGDTVTLTLRDDQDIVLSQIESNDFLPYAVEKNTASVVVKKFCEQFELKIGFDIKIKKGIPLSSGLGGSAASAVAAAVACNAFLITPLSKQALVQLALSGEAVASGGQAHADNIAPCVYGGLTMVSSCYPIEIISLPVPNVFCTLVHPHLYVNTKEARSVLSDSIKLVDHVSQAMQLANFMVAIYKNNTALLKKSLTDFLVEPQRAQFVPGFYAIKQAALDSGALGMSFSGSGPTLFALAETKSIADSVAAAMCASLKSKNIGADCWVSTISAEGARLLKIHNE